MSFRPLLTKEVEVLKTVLSFIGGVAAFAIPIPLWLIAAVFVGWQALSWWDTTAAVKTAVEKRVTEMITGAEKEALEARLQAEKDFAQAQTNLLLEAQRRVAVVQLANERLQNDLAQEQESAEDVNAKYEEMLKNPLKSCTVGPLYDELRNR